MPEPKRLESHPTSEAADRDSRAEALLVEGLDRYFSGQYDDAIHVWTRVLFLDRSHARARAYIDRARTALAERHRRAEEMLHTASGLLAEGQTERARALLAQVEAAGGDDHLTAELRGRLERMERARGGGSGSRGMPAVADAEPIRDWNRMSASRVAGVVIAAGMLLLIASTSVTVQSWLGFGAPHPPLPPLASTSPLPVLSSSEAALVRARTLYGRGRLADALQVLDRVGIDNAGRPEADRLRVEIQQILLATRRGTAPIASDRGPQ